MSGVTVNTEIEENHSAVNRHSRAMLEIHTKKLEEMEAAAAKLKEKCESLEKKNKDLEEEKANLKQLLRSADNAMKTARTAIRQVLGSMANEDTPDPQHEDQTNDTGSERSSDEEDVEEVHMDENRLAHDVAEDAELENLNQIRGGYNLRSTAGSSNRMD